MDNIRQILSDINISESHFLYEYQPLIELIRNRTVSSILNIGAGKGIESLYFAMTDGIASTCVDEYEGRGDEKSNQAYLTTRINEYALQDVITVCKKNAHTLSFPENSFDLIYTKHTLHHMFAPAWSEQERNIFFHNLYSITKKYVCIYEVGSINYKSWLKYIIPRRLKTVRSIHAVNYAQKKEALWWIEGLRNAGFENCILRYYIPQKLRGFKRILPSRLLSRIGSSQYIIIAKK